jgi:hypothetical protein
MTAVCYLSDVTLAAMIANHHPVYLENLAFALCICTRSCGPWFHVFFSLKLTSHFPETSRKESRDTNVFRFIGRFSDAHNLVSAEIRPSISRNLENTPSHDNHKYECPQQDRGHEPISPKAIRARDQHCWRSLRPRDQHLRPEGRTATASNRFRKRGELLN